METNYIDAELNATVAVYMGFVKHEEFQRISEGILEQVRQHRIHKVLVDTSASNVLPQANQQYIKDVWLLKAQQAGIKYMAFVLPKDHIGRLGVQDVNRAYAKTPIQLEHFTSINEARDWLRSK